MIALQTPPSFFFARSDDPDHYPLFVERQRPIIGQLDVPDEYFVVFRPLLNGGFLRAA